MYVHFYKLDNLTFLMKFPTEFLITNLIKILGLW